MEVPPKSDEESTSSDTASGESAEAKRRPRTRSRLYRTTKGVKTISAADVAEREVPAPRPAPVAAHADHDGGQGQPQGGEQGGGYDESGGQYQQHGGGGGGGKFGRRHRGKNFRGGGKWVNPNFQGPKHPPQPGPPKEVVH